jgi:tRNA (guanine-N7-)-methyltransferase
MAEKYPDVNFIAMELFSNVIVIAIERIFSAGLPNVRFICGNAVNLADYFAENELDKIYLNFSDPWTKKGHAKRRLTHPEFLKVYKNLLVPGGEIEQKTDDRLLFDYSLQSFKECGFSIEKLSYNLHSGDASDNILSEYEQKFIESGLPICKVLVKNQK